MFVTYSCFIDFNGGTFDLLSDLIQELFVLQNRVILAQFDSKFQEVDILVVGEVRDLFEIVGVRVLFFLYLLFLTILDISPSVRLGIVVVA